MNNNKIKQTILIIVDLLILVLSLKITLILRYANDISKVLEKQHFQVFTPIFGLWLVIIYINSLYDFKKIINQNKLVEKTVKSVLASFFLSMIIFYLVPYAQITPKTNLIIFSVFFLVLFLLWRLFFLSANKRYLPSSNIAIIGYNEIIRKTITAIKKNPQLGFKVKLIISPKNNVLIDIAEIYDLVIIEDVHQLSRAIKDYKIDSLILERDISDMKDLQKTLFNLLPTGINYYNLINFYEEISGQIPLEILNKAWFLENLNLAEKKNFERIKRVFDICLSFVFMIFALPICFFIILLVKISGPGPIIFKQTRLGKNNKDFNFYKFRTMRVENNNQAPTTQNDPRVTKIGKFLRKSRLDEIPQLFNVIKGDMSFVGPRPERPELIKELSNNIPFYNVRSLVSPGITGWDQISGEYHSPSIEDTYKKLQYDLFYIKNRSIYLDLSIILKTIRTALGHEGR
jgi:exopolysaccharide biosynthesis polyprenyl glycosylphosphotransferase